LRTSYTASFYMQGLLVTVSGQNNNIPNVPFMIKEVLSVRKVSSD
jgi:hypothetical protein